MRRAEPSTGSVAHPAVEGNPDDRDVCSLDFVKPRESGKGSDSGETGHDARVHRPAGFIRSIFAERLHI